MNPFPRTEAFIHVAIPISPSKHPLQNAHHRLPTPPKRGNRSPNQSQPRISRITRIRSSSISIGLTHVHASGFKVFTAQQTKSCTFSLCGSDYSFGSVRRVNWWQGGEISSRVYMKEGRVAKRRNGGRVTHPSVFCALSPSLWRFDDVWAFALLCLRRGWGRERWWVSIKMDDIFLQDVKRRHHCQCVV